MKNLQTYEEFLNEKAYMFVGINGTKGIWGKVLFAFKKQIEKIQFENEKQVIDEINKEWVKFVKKDAQKIIKDEVLKYVKSEESLVGITANLNESWEVDVTRGNRDDSCVIKYGTLDCVINIMFTDDVDANKFKRNLGGYVNTPLHAKNDVIILGEMYDTPNNIEIRTRMYLMIDVK